MQAIAAVLGVILTGLVTFGIIQERGNPATTPAGGGATEPGRPTVTLESVTVGAGSVEAAGSYSGLDESRQAVLFIGRPADSATDEVWIPVEAQLTSQESQGDTARGRWHATRPEPPPAARSSGAWHDCLQVSMTVRRA